MNYPNTRNRTFDRLEQVEAEQLTSCGRKKGDLIEKKTLPHVFLEELQTGPFRLLRMITLGNFKDMIFRL